MLYLAGFMGKDSENKMLDKKFTDLNEPAFNVDGKSFTDGWVAFAVPEKEKSMKLIYEYSLWDKQVEFDINLKQ
jgi:hypothetical protein